jgi:hypothetical protein
VQGVSADSFSTVTAAFIYSCKQILTWKTSTGTGLAIGTLRPSHGALAPQTQETIMKYEMLLIRGLFVATLLVSGLIFGTMLLGPGTSTVAGITTAAVQTGCVLPPDGVMCPQVRS